MSGNEQYVITVPEKAQIIVNRMTVPGESEEDVVAEMRALADSLDSPAGFRFTIDPPFYPPWETNPDHPLAKALTAGYREETSQAPTWGYWGFGDMNLFSSEAGIPTVMVGPLGGNFHQANEWVDFPSIAATSRLLVRIVGRVMNEGGAAALRG
jgi:succinyl-diaminopimelate desuccinylase